MTKDTRAFNNDGDKNH